MSGGYRAPQAGDRDTDPVTGHALEWTGATWTRVCPRDDTAMLEHDAEGWLCCGVCGTRAADADRRR